MNGKKRLLGIAIAAGLLGTLVQADAFSQTVTLIGTHVDFSYDDTQLGILGSPAVGGDTLFFSPTRFKAQSLNGAGLVNANASIYIDVSPHAGFAFDGALVTEAGDYKLRGTQSMVDVGGELLTVNKTHPASLPTATFLNPVTAPDQNDGRLHAWTAQSTLALAGHDVQRITLENLLDAYTGGGACTPIVTAGCGPQQAFIEKKYISLQLSTLAAPAAVPLPPALGLLFSGVLALLGFGSRYVA